LLAWSVRSLQKRIMQNEPGKTVQGETPKKQFSTEK
jgi:hypothetical protein